MMLLEIKNQIIINIYKTRDEANHIIEIISGFFAFTTLRELSTTYFKAIAMYIYIYIEKEERFVCEH